MGWADASGFVILLFLALVPIQWTENGTFGWLQKIIILGFESLMLSIGVVRLFKRKKTKPVWILIILLYPVLTLTTNYFCSNHFICDDWPKFVHRLKNIF